MGNWQRLVSCSLAELVEDDCACVILDFVDSPRILVPWLGVATTCRYDRPTHTKGKSDRYAARSCYGKSMSFLRVFSERTWVALYEESVAVNTPRSNNKVCLWLLIIAAGFDPN